MRLRILCLTVIMLSISTTPTTSFGDEASVEPSQDFYFEPRVISAIVDHLCRKLPMANNTRYGVLSRLTAKPDGTWLLDKHVRQDNWPSVMVKGWTQVNTDQIQYNSQACQFVTKVADSTKEPLADSIKAPVVLLIMGSPKIISSDSKLVMQVPWNIFVSFDKQISGALEVVVKSDASQMLIVKDIRGTISF